MAGKTKSRAYVQEWMRDAGLKQSDLVKKLGWSKAKANAVWHGEQRLNEDMIEELCDIVHARPYELLMPPKEARRFRSLEAALEGFAKPVEPPAPADPAPVMAPVRKRA